MQKKDDVILAPTSETTPLTQPPSPIWNPYAIANWSLLFTPVWGSVLISMNWKALNDKSRATKAIIWAFAFILLIPLTIASEGFFYFLLFLPTWYYLSCRPQAKYLLKTYGKAYPKRPWIMPVLFGWVAYGVIARVFEVIIKRFLTGWT